jgi:cell division septation protein DedD
LTSGYIVQVAAVSKQQDAEALVDALRRKQYQVSVVTPATDALFHVQIGPFGDPKDAEAVRSRLIADGYNPILKR